MKKTWSQTPEGLQLRMEARQQWEADEKLGRLWSSLTPGQRDSYFRHYLEDRFYGKDGL